MQAKKLKRDRARRFTESGLPRDPNEWTEDDWRDLNRAIEEIKAKVAARHAAKR